MINISQHPNNPTKHKQTLKEGFNKFVIKNEEGCWGWTGCGPKNSTYGQFRHGMKMERAHRASWILHFGEIPKGLWVLHKCDNKICSRPDHLFLGTQKDNNLDMLKKGYHSTLGKSGERNHMARLMPDQVKEIRSLLHIGDSIVDIAKRFGVSKSAISHIKQNNTWKELLK